MSELGNYLERSFPGMPLDTFCFLQIGDTVCYRVQSDPVWPGVLAKVVRHPCVSVWIVLLEPYHFNDIRHESGEMIIAGREELYFMYGRKCNVCGSIRGINCIEVFGVNLGQECGCSACVGVSYFPFGEKSIAGKRI